jgi:hypothetical protein
MTLARLRRKVFAEVNRLIVSWTPSVEYKVAELEQYIGRDDREAEDEHDELSLGWTDQGMMRGHCGGLDDRERTAPATSRRSRDVRRCT